jgi:hypothetical protein
VVVFNGFHADQDCTPWQLALEHVTHDELRLTAPVLDLAAYREAVERVPARSYCFLNSYSAILQDGWLELMRSLARRPRVGAVGASGSWGSQFSHLRYQLGLGGPYRHVFPDRQTTDHVFAGLSGDVPATSSSASRVTLALAAVKAVILYAAAFPAFPSPHLRTNCVLVERDVWLRVTRAPRDKLAAYRLESGRRGITARLEAIGLRALVAGRDGRAFEPSEWAASGTFWQGNQENLLVEDNQTRAYIQGDEAVRRVLSGYAWGPQADPGDALQTSDAT